MTALSVSTDRSEAALPIDLLMALLMARASS
jgi:hypothetical protein